MTKNSEEFHLVFEDGDPFRAEIVRAALEAGEVDCFIQNEGVQNLFALGSLGGMNPLMGTVKVYVRSEDRTRAEVLLADLQVLPERDNDSAQLNELSPESFPETPPSQGKGLLSFFRKCFLK